MTVGEKIARLRKDAGMTQSQLALRMGVTDGCISAWEHDRSEPNIGKIHELCYIFHVTTEEFLGKQKENSELVELIQKYSAADELTKSMVRRILNMEDYPETIEVSVGTF